MADIVLDVITCQGAQVTLVVDDEGGLHFADHDIDDDLIAEEMGFPTSRCLAYIREWDQRPVALIFDAFDSNAKILLRVGLEWMRGSRIADSRYEGFGYFGPYHALAKDGLSVAEAALSGDPDMDRMAPARRKYQLESHLFALQSDADAPIWLSDEIEGFSKLMLLAVGTVDPEALEHFPTEIEGALKDMDWVLYEADAERFESGGHDAALIRGRRRARVLLEALEGAELRYRR